MCLLFQLIKNNRNMRQFLKNILSSFLGTALAIGFGVLILVGIFASLASGGQNDLLVSQSNFLKISLSYQVVDYAEDHPLSAFEATQQFFPRKTGVFQIREALKAAAEDDEIKGVYLKLGIFAGGFGQAEEIREQLVKFKATGKKIVVYGDGFDEKSYYIATVADYIGLNPIGLLEFNGLKAETIYYTGLFEKLGVNVNVFKAGKYKSAVEPFFRKDMSEANKEQLSAFLGGIQTSLENTVAKARNLTPKQVKAVADSMLIRRAENAKTRKFVDAIAYEIDFLQDFKEKQGIEEIRLVTYTAYNSVHQQDFDEDADKVVVLFSEGEIIYGNSTQNKQIGHLSVVKQLRKLTEDSTVKAIVLNINSPGGSGHASDLMWKQLIETRKHKPVIASMSNYAASGGYYMAMACDKIVSHPMTITGSIGVFGMFPTFGGFMNDKLGVTSDRIKTGVYADLFSVNRKMRADEKAIVQTQIDTFYQLFVQKVADARGKTFEQIDEIASGRVWNGVQAKANGLVDELGGLDKAIAMAVEEAHLKDCQLVSYNKLIAEDMESILGSTKPETIRIQSSDLYQDEMVQQYIYLLEKINNCKGVQARLPFEMKID